ncbi:MULTISPECIES: ABC transporter ATP-binding protein [Lelliottia]|uniref:ABC transporter substrate-binding protein n=1 Tax=Lelliottia aquatilis TaxID=2080838 RepID=A0ABX5A6K8_9ENTR|nr:MULTISPECIES: ABC transporter ATP-binding protein [Lelliottia]ASV55519.1 Molybdenum transport ATP-binding protein ModC [Lelliottia jeotgali]NTZ44649.1 ABC transporter ATP-binding protein [Lelliottia aquatilis]POZ19179.1 ABC transporter substrate-binding protein [Lelliottia aquatilis]POZ27098.1 ABC transporter substrate-binding protein [Lelliottia aquatilis]POZ33851.1 ABC transporter substrate-binding protein [Lelliottia aquatilis]
MVSDITLNGVSYAFGANTVLNHIDLHIDAGSVVALLGPSGCGKSTLLRLLAGLTQPAAGEIFFGGRQVARAGWSLAPEARDIGMVFQDYALWPHMTVAQNVAFPLKMRNLPRRECEARVSQALSRVGLRDFAERKPAGLSGGQQQRVALARAIVAEPRVLLFDEPLSNLDSELRESLCLEMAALLRQLGTTAVYVTHDRREAEILADRIVHLSAGSVAADRLISSSGEFA